MNLKFNSTKSFFSSLFHAVNIELAIGPLLTAGGFLSSKSTIHALRSLKKGVIVCHVLVAEVGSGKSTAADMIREDLEELSEFLDEDESYFICGATIEAIIEEIYKKPNSISIYDEASQFFNMLGLYKSGPGAAAHDSAIFRTLANAPPSIQRDLKSGANKNIKIKNPRFNICCLGMSIKFSIHSNCSFFFLS